MGEKIVMSQNKLLICLMMLVEMNFGIDVLSKCNHTQANIKEKKKTNKICKVANKFFFFFLN